MGVDVADGEVVPVGLAGLVGVGALVASAVGADWDGEFAGALVGVATDNKSAGAEL